MSHAQVTIGPPGTVPNPGPSPIVAPALRVGNGTGAISGTVTDAVTGDPVAGALVTLNVAVPAIGQQFRPPPVARHSTDEKGRFVFRYLPASDAYYLTASGLGYLDSVYGTGSGGRLPLRIVLTDGQWFRSARIDVWRSGAITGRVLDEYGDPVVGVFVRVLRQVSVAGRRQWAAGIVTTTDDRGVYRLAGLDPGQYFVHVPSVQMAFPASFPSPSLPALDVDAANRLAVGAFMAPPPGGGQPLTYPGTFYPQALSLDRAMPVEAVVGRDTEGVDFRIEPVPGFRISGAVDGPASVASKLTVRLLPVGSDDLAAGAEAATALVGPNGTFSLLGVPAGDYVIDARGSLAQYEINSGTARSMWPTPPGMTSTGGSASDVPAGPPGLGITTNRTGFGDTYWGRQPISIHDRDRDGITLSLHRTATMMGRLQWENSRGTPTPVQPPRAILDPADGNPRLGQLRQALNPLSGDTDVFVIEGMMPGEYLFRLQGLGDSWAIKSITCGGRDCTDTTFDASAGRDFDEVVVTLTDRTTRVTGTVRSSDQPAVTSAVVIAFPVERSRWTNYGLAPSRIKSARLTSAGGFQFVNLPAGKYFLVAVDEALVDAWQNPEFLEAVARLGTPVSLRWGESQSVDLRLTPLRLR